MAWRRRAARALALLAGFASAAASHGEDAESPLPVDHTVILPSGGTYTVSGRVRIPKGVEITVQKGTKLVGHGKEAVVEVEGELKIRGVSDSKVTVEGVTFEVQPVFGEVRLDMVKVTGASRGVVSPKDKPCDGRIFVCNTEFEGGAGLDVTMNGNEIDLQRVYVRAQVRVKGVDRDGTAGNRVKLNLLNCCSGTTTIEPGALMGGVAVKNVHDVTVRACRIGGEKTSFADCDEVTFDANQVKSATLEFTQTEAGRFGKTTMSKCDVLSEKVVVWAPAAEGRPETMPCDKCWFNGETDEKAVRTKLLRDHEDDPKCGVTIELTKLMDRPLLIAGKIK